MRGYSICVVDFVCDGARGEAVVWVERGRCGGGLWMQDICVRNLAQGERRCSMVGVCGVSLCE